MANPQREATEKMLPLGLKSRAIVFRTKSIFPPVEDLRAFEGVPAICFFALIYIGVLIPESASIRWKVLLYPPVNIVEESGETRSGNLS